MLQNIKIIYSISFFIIISPISHDLKYIKNAELTLSQSCVRRNKHY